MVLPIGGMIGAMIAIVLAVIGYAMIIGYVEAKLRALDQSTTEAEREAFEEKLSVMRRTILGLDIAVFATLGYLIGTKV